MCGFDRAGIGTGGGGLAGASPQGGTNIARSTATGPNSDLPAASHSGPGVLPAFVTPEWLAQYHHLMKADMRKLAAQLREDYPDWPVDADGGDAAAFWSAVHALADRWTYFLPLFEERILTTFGRVKGVKKQLVPRLLAGNRAPRSSSACPFPHSRRGVTRLPSAEASEETPPRRCGKPSRSTTVVSPWSTTGAARR